MKRYIKLTLIIVLSVLFLNFSSNTVSIAQQQERQKQDGMIFYEIFVRSFYDSNGDGIGDINGLAEKLIYIKSLGVNGIWLMPIFESPSYHGYDVIDYYKVNHEYGTNQDFINFINKAHKMGIKVIIDLVINHTSSKHPWFIEASSNEKSKFRNYYIWADKNTNLNELSPFGSKQWYKKGDGYFNAIFWSEMPDLNFDNKDVRNEMKKIAKFWLDRGVDGFRFDAAMHIYPPNREKDNLSWWQEYADYCRSIKKDIYLIGEVWDNFERIAPYMKPFDSCFNFTLANNIIDSVNYETSYSLQKDLPKIYENYKKINKDYVDAPFLTNHDMNRAFSQIDNMNKMKLAAALLLTIPGNPFIYYGEEIGMKGQKPDEFIREPFKWFDLWGKGQTKWEMNLYNTGVYTVSVEKQEKDKNSLLNFYKDMINFKKSNLPVLKGDFKLIKTSEDLFAFVRTYNDKYMLMIFNLTDKNISHSLTLPKEISIKGSLSKGQGYISWTKDKKLSFKLKPYSFVIIK